MININSIPSVSVLREHNIIPNNKCLTNNICRIKCFTTNNKNIDSKILLKKCAGLLADKGFKISNVDSIICAQAPKMKPYIDQMQSCMADVLGLDSEDVTVKATTTEHLGFVGRKEGISAYATVLIYKE